MVGGSRRKAGQQDELLGAAWGPLPGKQTVGRAELIWALLFLINSAPGDIVRSVHWLSAYLPEVEGRQEVVYCWDSHGGPVADVLAVIRPESRNPHPPLGAQSSHHQTG